MSRPRPDTSQTQIDAIGTQQVLMSDELCNTAE